MKTTVVPSPFRNKAVLMITLGALTWGTAAKAQNQVTLTGDLNPMYSVKISPSDLDALTQGLSGINQMSNIKVDVNSIYSENDTPAFQAASQEVSRVLIEAAKSVVDMRAIVYKLNIDMSRANGKFTQQITEAYQQHFQRRYKSLLALFLGAESSPAGQSFNEALSTAMEMCFTTSCLQDIADAQLDLVEFGQSINSKIDLSSSTVWEGSVKSFRSRIVKDTVRKTMDNVLATNQKESAYVKILRIAAAPFVVAATGAAQATSEFARLIASPELNRYKITADGYLKRPKEWKALQAGFEARVGENYKKIIADGNGGLKYRALTSTSPSESSTSSSPGSSTSTAIDPFVSLINHRITQLSQSTNVDEQMAMGLLLGEAQQGGLDNYMVAQINPVIATAVQSGMKVANYQQEGTISLDNGELVIRSVRGGVSSAVLHSSWANCTMSAIRAEGFTLYRTVAGEYVLWAVTLQIPGVSTHLAFVKLNLKTMIEKSGSGFHIKPFPATKPLMLKF